MAASGSTPIQLYYSTTNGSAPLATNLAYGELAVNTYNGKLYYKNYNTGAVSVLADGSVATGNLPGGSAGSVVYQSAPGATAYLTIGSAGSILYSNGTAPAYASIGAAGSILYSNGSAPTSLAIGASNTVLISNGSIPQFVSQSSLSVGTAATAGFATTAGSASTATSATSATNLSGGGTNQVVYQSASGTSSFVTAPTVIGTVLSYNGSGFTWASAPAATTTSNISGGAQYQIPFQSGVGATTFSSNLTFNSSTNTFGSTNITATTTVSGTNVTASSGITAGTTIGAGTSIAAGSSISATTSVTGATIIANGSITASATTGAYSYGTLSYSDTNIFASHQTSANSYTQKIMQNTSNGAAASVDFIVSNDQGTATTYYGDFGMNSSGFSGVGPFQAAGAVYLYSISTDLVIGTKSSNYLRLVTNDNSADSITVSPTNAVAFNGNYGTSGQILTSSGTGSAPVWVNSSSIGVSNGKLYFFGQF